MSIARLENVGGDSGLLAAWTKSLQSVVFSFRHSNCQVAQIYQALACWTWFIENAFVHCVSPSNFPSSHSVTSFCISQEYKRFGLPNNLWRITDINNNYAVCDSYPHLLVVPAQLSDSKIKQSAKFRGKHRVS